MAILHSIVMAIIAPSNALGVTVPPNNPHVLVRKGFISSLQIKNARKSICKHWKKQYNPVVIHDPVVMAIIVPLNALGVVVATQNPPYYGQKVFFIVSHSE